jgi:hypothetical protein
MSEHMAANVEGICEVAAFCDSAASFTLLLLNKDLWLKDSSGAAILQIQC